MENLSFYEKRAGRREFLKTSAGLASAVVVGPLEGARGAHATGNDRIRVGLIGCGGRGAGAALNAMNVDPGVELIAMADIFTDKVEKSLQQLKEAKPKQVAVKQDHRFVGFDAYRKVIESGVDLVLIACASRFHPIHLKACVDAGRHVFVEKPHAIDPVGVRLVKEAAKQAEKKEVCVSSGLMSRHNPAWQETIRRVQDGAIGDLVAAEANFLRGPYGLVQRRPEWSEIEFQYHNWYHFNWLSGDDVIQSLVHNVDRVAWALGEEQPIEAHGLGGRSSNFGRVYGNVFDHHSVVYEYEGGRRMYAFCRTQPHCYGTSSDILHGSKGRCDLMKARIEGEVNWHYEGPKANMYEVEQQELIRAIRSGRLINDGFHMASSTLTAVMGQIACYTGNRITWKQMLDSEFAFGPAKADFSIEPPVEPDADGIYPVPVPGVTQMAEFSPEKRDDKKAPKN